MPRSRHRFRKKLKRHFRARRALYQLLAIVGGSAGVIALLFVGLHWLGTEGRPVARTTAPATEEPTAVEVVPPIDRDHRGKLPARDLTVHDVVERVFAAHGGRDAVRTLSSLRQEGRLEQSDADSLFITFFWRAPNLVRYTVVLKNGEVRRAFNGEQAWEAQLLQGEVKQSWALPDVEKEGFIRDSHMSQPAVFSLLQTDRLSLAPPAEINGRRCHVIVLQRRSYREFLYFDQINFLCLRRERSDADLPKGAGQIRVDYSDFRQVGEFVFPFLHQTSVDGILHNQVTLQKLTPNAGLLTSLFNPPAR